MQAWAVLEAGAPLQRIELPTPVPTGTQVLMAVTHCGVCHSDVHFWEGFLDMGGPAKVPVEAMGIQRPLTLGHEVVGRVAALGPEAAAVPGAPAVGELRLVYPWVGCGECAACLAEEDNDCAQSRAIGLRQPGGFGEYVVTPHPRHLIDIGDIPPALAATYACSGLTVYAALKKVLPVPPDQPVVIIGAGGLGLSAIQILRAQGHRAILVVDIDPAKRAAALAAGASAAIDGTGDDLGQRLLQAAGRPLRTVVDLVNNPQTASAALAAVGRGGTIVQVGMFGGAVSLPLMKMPALELTLRGSFVGSPKELRELIELARSGALDPIPLATRPRDQASAALQDLHDGEVVGRLVMVA